MRISDIYLSKYVKHQDLKGQEKTVRIRDCIEEELGQGNEKERKPVLYFEGQTKGFVCNKTNSAVIVEAYGDDTSAWTGRDIVLFVDPNVMFQGKVTPAIRVRVPQAAPQPTVQHAPASPAPEPDAAPLNDEIPW